MELISKEETRKIIDEILCSTDYVPFWVFDKFSDGIESIPIIEERKEGKWMHLKNNQVCCSICGYLTTWIEDIDIHGMAIALLGEKYAKYCPNCGARMTASEEEHYYQRAIEDTLYNEQYESAYNSEDGSM